MPAVGLPVFIKGRVSGFGEETASLSLQAFSGGVTAQSQSRVPRGNGCGIDFKRLRANPDGLRATFARWKRLACLKPRTLQRHC
jgi:hypothetical protein